MNLLDAHQHFWRYTREEYGWINDEMAPLRRDFLPADLREEAEPLNVVGSIAVQARQSLDETRWLLELAEQDSFIKGVVGWIPLADPAVQSTLEELADHPALCGVRHVAQDEPEGFLLRDDFNQGVARLAGFNLAYDVLIYERQLPEAIEFVDRHPQQRFVLDHLAKPRVAAAELEPWRANLLELGRRPNVSCKLSGVVTEADWRTWDAAALRPYLETALSAFGPTRLMFGSDWPVCLVASDYARWVATVLEFIEELSAAEQSLILSGAAVEAYGLTGVSI